MKKKLSFIGFSLLLIFFVFACAPGNEMFVEESAGFWMGLWHGFISVFTLIIGFFDLSVKIYETNNTGWWYDLGFIMGAGFAFSNIWFTGNKARRKRSS
jgi:hypothetical protein